MIISDFVGHESCPSCGSKDNLARYSDGHAWCFGCGYHENANGIKVLREALTSTTISETHKTYEVSLPEDFSYSIPPIGALWLRKYGLSFNEIREHRIGWSDKGIVLKKNGMEVKPLLILPVFDVSGELLFWQGRNFGINGPKYYTKGYKETIYHILENKSRQEEVVVVEDIISAIKVARKCSAMPILGSTISMERLQTLSERFSTLTLWLDKDKQIEARKTSLRASMYFYKVNVVLTELDPKEYDEHQIEDFLNR